MRTYIAQNEKALSPQVRAYKTRDRRPNAVQHQVGKRSNKEGTLYLIQFISSRRCPNQIVSRSHDQTTCSSSTLSRCKVAINIVDVASSYDPGQQHDPLCDPRHHVGLEHDPSRRSDGSDHTVLETHKQSLPRVTIPSPSKFDDSRVQTTNLTE